MGMFKKPGTAMAPAKKAAAPSSPGLFGKSPSKSAPTKAVAKKAAPRRDDDDEDEGYDGDGGVTTGWGGAEKMAAEHSGFAARLTMKEETIVMKFLDDAPYANVATHWVKRKGRQSFICHGKGKCPLCAIGDNPRVTYCFNVVKLTDTDPLVLSWEVGVKLYRQIEKKAKDPKTSPLNSVWYELERTGTGKDDTTYTLKAIPARRFDDVMTEEYPNLVVPTARQLANLTGYNVEDALKQKASLKEMKELASEISRDDYEDDGDDD